MNQTPSDLLWRMQQETVAAGYTLPEQAQDERRWGGLGFGVGEQRMVAALTNVTDVVDYSAATRVPCTQDWVRGIANVRGNLYSVVDLGMFMELAPAVAENDGRLLVVNEDKLNIALLVHRIYGLRYFDEEKQRQDVSVLNQALQSYASHAFLQDDELWGVLDTDSLITADTFLNIGTEM